MTIPAEPIPLSINPVRRGLRTLRRALFLLAMALLVFVAGHGDYRPTELQTAMAPYQYSIVEWELGHLTDKWTHALSLMWPGRRELTNQEEADLVREFFALGIAERRLESHLRVAKLGRGRAKRTGAEPPASSHRLCRALPISKASWNGTGNDGGNCCPTSNTSWKKR